MTVTKDLETGEEPEARKLRRELFGEEMLDPEERQAVLDARRQRDSGDQASPSSGPAAAAPPADNDPAGPGAIPPTPDPER